jgi:hypothetical protein
MNRTIRYGAFVGAIFLAIMAFVANDAAGMKKRRF